MLEGDFGFACRLGYEAIVDPRVAKQSDYNLGIDPRKLVLVPGQCAQLQFVTR